MTEHQSAAYVFAQSVAALAAIKGMKAENQRRAHLGQGPAWGESSFAEIADHFGIGSRAASAPLAIYIGLMVGYAVGMAMGVQIGKGGGR